MTVLRWKAYAETFLKAFLAGTAIGVGGTVYLSIENKLLGAFLFAIGLFIIFSFGFNLYTGKIGYLITSPPRFLVDLVFIWLGNLLGACFVGVSLCLTRVGDKLSLYARALCETKLADAPLSIVVLSFFCGLLMYIAAENYKSGKSPLQQHLAVFLPVMVFILSGFEHCVANMYYFSVAGLWSPKAFGYMGLMTLGNSLGAFLIPLVQKLCALCADRSDKA